MNTTDHWGFPALQNLEAPEALSRAIRRIYRRMLTTPSGGNLSVRGDDGTFWFTPSMVDKGALTSDDMVALLPDGSFRGKAKPTSEHPFHLAIYKARPDIRAVVHAHPVSLVAASIVGELPRTACFPLAHAVCPRVGIAPYALPGSQTLGERIAAVFAQGIDTVFLESHGIVVGGSNLEDALRRFETIEHVTDIEIAARRLGPTLKIPQADAAGVQFSPGAPSALPQALPEEAAVRESLATFIRRGYVQRLIWPGQYVFSARIGASDQFLINASDSDPASVGASDLVKVDARTLAYAGALTPHPWAALHAALYRKEPACNAVFIANPTAVGAFCVSEAALDTRTIPESYIFLREARRMGADWWKDGARAWVDSLSIHHPVRLLENTGAAVIGKSLFAVLDAMEVLESTARSLLEAQSFGALQPMGPAAIAEIKTAFNLKD